MSALLMWLLTAFAAEPAPIEINSATADQLAMLDNVSEGQAEAIVALANTRGGIRSVEELRVIRDLDADALASLRSHTVVDIPLVEFPTRTYSGPDEVLAEFAHEPTVHQVQDWASSYARVSPEAVQRWLAASKSFAALPQLTVEYRFDDGWDQDFEYSTDAGDEAASAPAENHTAVLNQAGRDQGQRYLVRARWDLDQLVMSSERIRIINEAQDIVKLRDKILGEATRLYFERRRVQVEMLLSPKRDTMAQVKQQLRLLELTANMDALTGGAFSQALARTSGKAAPTPKPDGVDL